MDALPSDLVDPAEAFAPAETFVPTAKSSPTVPSDLVDPSQGNFGGSAPVGDQGDSAAKAFGYGVVKGTPFASKVAAAGVPVAEAIGSSLNWLKGGANEDQKKAMAGLPQSYDEASQALATQGGQAAEEHPWLYTTGTALPQALLPGGASVKGAAIYGGALGLGEGESPAESVAHGVLGAAGGAAGAGIAQSLFPAVGGMARDTVLGAAKRLGVGMPRYSVGLPITQMAGKIAHSVPGASAPVEEATRESIEGLGTAAAGAAGSATKETAGAAAKRALTNWIGPVSKGNVDAKYAAANQLMNQRAQTPLYTAQAIASQIAQRRQAAGLSGTGGAVGHIAEALQRPGGLTYNGIKDLRTSVGEMMDQSILPQGMSGSELKQIYSGLSTDLDRAAFNAGGQRGLQAHNAANAFAKQTADRREQLVSLLGGPQAGSSDEAVFGAIKRAAGSKDNADIALLKQAQSVIPGQSWNELGRGFVSQMGRDTDGNFSPLRFLTDYNGLSDKGKDALFATNTSLRRNLDDLATVSQQWKSLGKYANPSGTAGHVAGIGMVAEARDHPIEVLASYLGAKGIGKFLASSAGAGAAATWTRAISSGQKKFIRDAAVKLSGVAGAQIGARVDPMALAALALKRYLPEHGGGGDNSGGGQPQ